MSKTILSKKGFTLIEVIATLVLVSILTAMVGLGIYNVFQGFVTVKSNVAMAQKGQLAVLRIMEELGNLDSISSGSANAVTFQSYSYSTGTLAGHTLSWGGAGAPLTFDGDTLIDNVSGFTIGYLQTYNGAASSSYQAGLTKLMEVTLSHAEVNNTTSSYTLRFVPRNL